MTDMVEPGKPAAQHRVSEVDWTHPNDHPLKRFMIANRASLGSLAVFVIEIAVYAKLMNAKDLEYGIREDA